MLLGASSDPVIDGTADQVDSLTSAGTVQDVCSRDGVVSALACNAYLRGAMEGLIWGQLSMTEDEVTFCLPEGGLSSGDAKAIFLGLVDGDPERRWDDAGATLLEALEDNFPCPDDDDLTAGSSTAGLTAGGRSLRSRGLINESLPSIQLPWIGEEARHGGNRRKPSLSPGDWSLSVGRN